MCFPNELVNANCQELHLWAQGEFYHRWLRRSHDDSKLIYIMDIFADRIVEGGIVVIERGYKFQSSGGIALW
jgi:hypothetical protein